MGPSPDGKPATLRVLVVEDDPADLELALRALRQARTLTLDSARTGAEALAAAAQRPYDVILLDYRLPDWEGARLCRELRSRGVEARIVMVTGAASETMVARALEAGAERVVAKSGDYLRRLREELAPEEASP